MDGTTDLLLVAAPFYHIHGQEGRVYMYRLNEQVGESPSLHLLKLWLLSLVQSDRGWEHPGRPCPVLVGGAGWMVAGWGSCSTPFPTPLSYFPHPTTSWC